MNRRCHRLVFSRRLGLRIAVSEAAQSHRKAAGGGSSAVSLAVAALLLQPAGAPLAQTRPPVVFASRLAAPAAPLPQPNSNAGRSFAYDPARGDPRRGGSSPDLRDSGQVRWTPAADGKSAVFDQGSVARVVVNWDSFDIAAGHRVHFAQDKDPTRLVSALNRIWSADPSQILGSLSADREVILVNANGVYFGRGARVDTGRFVATTHGIADAVFEKGLRNIVDGSAVFAAAADGPADAAVSVEAGAQIRSAAGGDVLLIAPRVSNQGRISTPGGQAVLAAGDKVYLMSSSDPAQRGLIVAVDPLKNADGSNDSSRGTVENAARGSTADGLVETINEIRADSGNVNLVGLAVRQHGVINATTAVKGANGGIYLQAMASTTTLPAGAAGIAGSAGARGFTIEAGASVRVADQLGSVDIGAGSVTAVKPDAGPRTQIDAEVSNPSRIRVEGQAIAVGDGARIQAPGGRVELLAAASTGNGVFDGQLNFASSDDGSRIVVAPNALISTAGLRDVEVDGARFQGSQRLFRIELADAPVQRSGPLYRQQVLFDLRDGSKIGAANVSGSAAAITRTAAEKATAGGSLRIESQGTVALAESATLDVSGGSVQVAQTVLQGSLVERNGNVMAFRSAAAGNALDTLLVTPQRFVSPAYTEGRSGGSLLIAAQRAALNAQTVGSVIVGQRQRDGRDPRAAAARFSLGRSTAAGASLVSAISLEAGAAPVLPAALWADPLAGALDHVAAGTRLSLPALNEAGFGHVSLLGRSVEQLQFGRLDVGPGGVIEIQSQSTLLINGAYSAAGGRITLTGATDTELQPGTQLDAAGVWTNDTVAGSPGAVQVAGGSIGITAQQGSLRIGSGSLLDVSAGAWLNAGGTLSRGSAGTLALSGALLSPSVEGAASSLSGVRLAGVDFAGGGKLTLQVQDLLIGPGAAATGGHFVADTALFSAHGFGQISIHTAGDLSGSNSGDIVIGAGTHLLPVLQNWQLATGWRQAASGALPAAAAVIDPQQAERAPVSIALNAARPLALRGQIAGSSLTVERGASIELDPGATLVLSATRRLEIGHSGQTSGGSVGDRSELVARGGRIELALKGVRGSKVDIDDPAGFVADQAIWLGAGARLDVSGTALLRPDSMASGDRVTGRVLAGGTIGLNAERGYVLAQAGSQMQLDGTSAALNLPGVVAPVTVAQPAGRLELTTPEGFVLDGSVSAHAPQGGNGLPAADGGRLLLSLARGGNEVGTLGAPYLDSVATPRQLRVGAFEGLLAARGTLPGTNLADTLGNGNGFVNRSLLLGAGFAGLSLAAGDHIRFEQPLALNMPLGLRLDTPAVSAAPAVVVDLRTAYAQLGDTSTTLVSRALPADRSARSDGGATLAVTAPTIELIGDWGLQGFASTAFNADRELRLTAAARGVGTPAATGGLAFAGQLNINAGQVYATSGTAYTLAGLAATDAADAGSRLEFARSASSYGTALPPLSAFGALLVSATDIVQGGVLKQPFGSIALQAERRLVLTADSVTSVSGQGATVLYGQTSNLSSWNLPGGGAVANVLPRAKGVLLQGAQIETAPSASVSAAGGGLLLASEFFPGVGGSRDYLADTPGLYALLPDYAATQALNSNGGLLPDAQQARELVIKTPGAGLAAGRYTLLPARYALLGGDLPHGAFIVSRAADQGRTPLTQAVAQDDGSAIVAGHLVGAGGLATGTPAERFVVEPVATFSARSEVRLTDINDYLTRRGTTNGSNTNGTNVTNGSAIPALPRDAGSVQVTVRGNTRGVWQAGLQLAGAAGGRAGELDFSATRLALVDDATQTPAGAFGVSADVLAASGAGSVLLGATRSTVGGRSTLDGSATSEVTVDLGHRTLALEELVLAAQRRIALAEGTRIEARPGATLGARTLASRGDGALLAVSANALQIERSDVAAVSGDIQLGANSHLAGQQLVLDASTQLLFGTGSTLAGQASELAARRLRIGAAAAPLEHASVIDDRTLLDSLRNSPALTLRGYDLIDFAGSQAWAGRSGDGTPTVVTRALVLDAPLLRGVGIAGVGNAVVGNAVVDIAAQDIVLRNSSGRSADSALAADGSGSLQLHALPPLRHGHTGGMTLGPGALTLGFGSVALRSAGDIALNGSTGIKAAQDLKLSAARLTATSGASATLAAAGTLTLAAEVGSRTLGERVGQGADVTLSATRLLQQGHIDLPAARLSLLAAGDNSGAPALLLGAGSVTSVAGFTATAASGFATHGSAGRIGITAASGDIALLGKLDIGAAASANAGQIALQAAGGSLLLAPTSTQLIGGGANGGSLRVDVANLSSADALVAVAQSGGLNDEFKLRVRQGDLTLDRGLQARRIVLAADIGTLTLGSAAALDARAPAGGVVQLAAGGDLRLVGGARIDAGATRSGNNGGDVLLTSSDGRIRIAAGAAIDSRGDDAADGRIVLRAGRAGAGVRIDALDTAALQAGEVNIEAVRRYSGVSTISSGSGNGATLGTTRLRTDNAAFMADQGAVRSVLGLDSGTDGARFHLRAGVEVQSAGNLTLNSDWALNADRPGGDAGFLTLRAAGDLLLNGSLSDGFTTTTAAGVLNDNVRSWSLRLAAGADLLAADPLQVQTGAAGGDITVAGNRLVRTGAGSIELAAARDVIFASGTTAGGLAYVAGRKSAEMPALLSGLFKDQTAKPTITDQGGRLAVAAGRDIVSAEATQLVNNWLWRSGLLAADGASYSASNPLAWWTEFSRFRQTLGSFGGGNLHAEAGGDIRNLQAMLPSAAWADSRTAADATLQVRNGGDLTVVAGGSVLGGQFLVGRGEGRLSAGNVVQPLAGNVRKAETLLALIDGHWNVSARAGVVIGAAFNPTLAPLPAADGRATLSPFFVSQGADSALVLAASTGAVQLYGVLRSEGDYGAYGLVAPPGSGNASGLLFQTLPPQLSISAPGGAVALMADPAGGRADALLAPSATGGLAVWSGGDLIVGSRLALADGSAGWPDFRAPLARTDVRGGLLDNNSGVLALAVFGITSGSALHAASTTPLRLHAEGSIVAQAQQDGATLVLPKAAEISAGADIRGLQLLGQNQRASDTTLISAGRNLLAGPYGGITLAGPGRLDIEAGSQIDLDSSNGVATIGNTRNPTLPAQGAAVRLAAATAGRLDLAALDRNYLQPEANPRAAAHRLLLLAQVRQALNAPALDFAQAWVLFGNFPPAAQAAFGRRLLAAEFGAVYLAGSVPDAAAFQASLRKAFERRQADLLQALDDALAASAVENQRLTLPGREQLASQALLQLAAAGQTVLPAQVLRNLSLESYREQMRVLRFDDIDSRDAVQSRIGDLQRVQQGWRDSVAAGLGSSALTLDMLATREPGNPAVLAWHNALTDYSGRRFEQFRQQVLVSETSGAGTAASDYGRSALPLRMALVDQGFAAAELAGAGSFTDLAAWHGAAPLLAYAGSLDMTQSSVVSERGGGISLVNAGGAINVGLKDDTSGAASAAKGVIALGGGNIFGFAKNDFQVNNQRVFVVGRGDMTIWSSIGDIDSGRGANTAVAAPPLAARRGVDGTVFETPATTTGSGLGILEDAAGLRAGTIGLFPAQGEIRALDAFIRAPSVVVGSTIRGADNLATPNAKGAAAPVSVPPLTVTPPATQENRATESLAGTQGAEARQRNSLLTVELVGMGPAADEDCSEADRRANDNKCPRKCSSEDKTAGRCR